MTNLEIIREACIKANPEIIELKFGCEVVWTSPASEENKKKAKRLGAVVIRNWGNGAISILDKFHVNVTQATHTVFASDFNEIIGRPIRLADVLILLGNGWTRNRQTREYDLDQKCQAVVCQWSMTNDDLSHQSEETLEFLDELLTNK